MTATSVENKSTKDASIASKGEDTIFVIETTISRDDIINGIFSNKNEEVIAVKPINKADSIKIDTTIVDFLNTIYETVNHEIREDKL